MKYNVLVIVFGLFLFGACVSNQLKEENTFSKYKSKYKTVCRDSVAENQLFNRYCESFFPQSNDLAMQYTSFNDSIYQGYYTMYYPNGNILEQGEYLGGAKINVFKSFYENGKKKTVATYTIIERNSYLNQYAKYDSISGDLDVASSFFYSIEILPVNNNEDSVDVHFVFNCPMYNDSVVFEFASYKDVFIDNNDKSFKSFVIKDQERTMRMAKSNFPKNTVSGRVHDFELDGEKIVNEKVFYILNLIK